jgi:U3 small nucleolar RNA-associated protein 12
MQHTYLRYECADAFALTTASASSKAPPSNSILAFSSSASPSNPIVLTTAASYVMGFHLKQSVPCLKVGHREQLSGGVGTGRALNSDEVVCLSINGEKIATGWVDGAVRVFDVLEQELNSKKGLVHSLIHDNVDEEFVMREPLVLNGHTTPVRSLTWDDDGTRLASGGTDGSVVLWDVVAETGLFRLLGHRGAITDISFVSLEALNCLITTSLDGLVKVWDLNGQCCTQTIASHRGEVWASACSRLYESDGEKEARYRLITGSTDGQVRVWSVKQSRRSMANGNGSAQDVLFHADPTENPDAASLLDNTISVPSNGDDDVCHYMGSLLAPPNVSTSNEKVTTLHFHTSGRYVGILHANSKNIDVYMIRSFEESSRKKQRRLRRRREKKGKSISDETKPKKGNKRGILDDPESSADEDDAPADSMNESLDPELIKASDEFEYYGTARATHKIRGFAFVPFREKGGGLRIVCALSTNALETLSLIKRKKR